MKLSFYICLLTLNTFALTKEIDLTGRIFNGKDAPPGKWPFYSLLVIRAVEGADERSACGCVVIATRWIVSAAHCTAGHPADTLFVHAGFPTSMILDYEQASRVKAKHEHPEFNAFYVLNDIVLLELYKELKFNSLVRPISLPESKVQIQVGKECKIVGFGKTGGEETLQERKLQEGDVTVISKFDCLFAYGHIIRDSNICANHPTAATGSCKGDSGGPLACFDDGRNEYVLRGVTSFGATHCGDNTTPEVWSRITWYLDWMNEKMRDTNGLLT